MNALSKWGTDVQPQKKSNRANAKTVKAIRFIKMPPPEVKKPDSSVSPQIKP
jgi:hypothetical protein